MSKLKNKSIILEDFINYNKSDKSGNLNNSNMVYYYVSDKYYLKIQKGSLYFTIPRYSSDPIWKKVKTEQKNTFDFSDIGTLHIFEHNFRRRES